MIKLIASDLDGTLLLNGAQTLQEELFPLIKKLKKLGIRFVAASGRQYANMERMFGPVKDDIVYICENGGLAVEDGRVLYQSTFDSALARKITETIMAREGAEFSYSTRDFYYMIPKTEYFRNHMVNVIRNNCREIKSLDEIEEPCLKLALYEQKGVQEESVRFWKEQFGSCCTVVTSGNAWIDFIPFGTNKARGLLEFQKKYGLQPEECVVFGDEFNDLEMLRAVPWSFAMAHSRAGVRSEASYVTERVEPVLNELIRTGGDMKAAVKNLNLQ